MAKSNISLGTKVWVERINAAWQSSVDSILRTGQLLVEAKEALGKGEFINMIANELRFHESTAKRLILIGQDTRLSSHANFLPPHWYTLYELTRLSDEEFDRAIESKKITPDMERSDVPRQPRNLSARPRPKMIEGSATEVKPQSEALPIPETPQPARQPAPPRGSSSIPETPLQTVQRLKELERDVARLEEEKAKLKEAYDKLEDFQEFGAGDRFTATFLRNRPDANFWTGLTLAIDEWFKLDLPEDLWPDRDSERFLNQCDLGRVIRYLDALNGRLRDARNAA